MEGATVSPTQEDRNVGERRSVPSLHPDDGKSSDAVHRQRAQ